MYGRCLHLQAVTMATDFIPTRTYTSSHTIDFTCVYVLHVEIEDCSICCGIHNFLDEKMKIPKNCSFFKLSIRLFNNVRLSNRLLERKFLLGLDYFFSQSSPFYFMEEQRYILHRGEDTARKSPSYPLCFFPIPF